LRAEEKVKVLARDEFWRDLCLKQRISTCITFYSPQSTDFPNPEGARSTTLNGNILVYGVVWSSGCLYQTLQRRTEAEGRRYGLDRCSSQMPCLLSYKILNPSGQEWFADCWVAQSMGLVISQEESPAHKSVSSDLGIPTHLFSRMGVYGTPEAGRNRAGF
jgi:hypothetical protein